ncbi:hypothetical protein [Pseudoscardovia suis]|uniref:Uncharacterized protein n=1 Tax=Pseudoscardovia suis TaxID=987063 RepID=A0A261F462_9BIFI|nr:hypothetical protein [Pseudoscardovia suis]OZG53902.1 hypothetical protein PSSU_0005 [Pseudoscardovia suis]PJJ65860.1 hypothetical protein CLV65_1424 [Pseudoscardovia suis]
MSDDGGAAPRHAEYADSLGFAEYGDVHARDRATRLDSDVFPYEAKWHWHMGGRAAVSARRSRISGWLVLGAFVTAIVVCVVRFVISIVSDAQAAQRDVSGQGLTHLSSDVIVVVFAVLMVIMMKKQSSKLSASDKRERGRVKAVPDGDATTVLPERSLIDLRSARCIGDAFPLTSGRIDVASAVTPAWRIPDAGPLRAVSGRIVDTLALDATYAVGPGLVNRWDFRVFFALVECSWADGGTVRCWSNALLGDCAPGQKVTAYLYRFAPDGRRPFLRVHDLADASQPVNVEDHQAVVFSYELEDWRSRTADDAGTGGAIGASRSDSYGLAVNGRPYGRTWHENVTAVGYWSDRAGYAKGVLGADGRATASKPFPRDDLRIGDGNVTEFSELRRFRRFPGVVEDVVVVPLFNRRFWCGYGYMALVRFERRGKEEAVWAFCDPGRDDSYLGADENALRRPAVRVGDSVALWYASGGLCVVDPVA